MGYKTSFPVVFYRFSFRCTVNGSVYGTGTGTSAIAARQAAAKQVLEKLKKEDAVTVCAKFSLKTEA